MVNLSIATVCYNAAKDLELTIKSVSQQTYTDFEYIIIDGNSKDETHLVLNEARKIFQQKGIKITILSEPDSGVYDAMNKAAQIASGKWINYMNAGDVFYSNTCLDDFFQTPIKDNIGYCYGDCIEIYKWGELQLSKNKQIKKNHVMPFSHQASFVRVELMKKNPFNLKYRIIADYDLFYRLNQQGILSEFRPIIICKFDAIHGMSANNPLQLNLERLKIHGINNKYYYPIYIIKIYIRQGLIQPLKKILPEKLTNFIMRFRRE